MIMRLTDKDPTIGSETNEELTNGKGEEETTEE